MASVRVCLVDDDDLVRDALTLGLRDSGFLVSAAADWNQASALLAEGADIILTDLQLPGLEDAEIVGRIRACAPQTPIIALSGSSSPAIGAKARALGADEFLTKPAALATITGAIAGLLKRSDSRAA